MGRSLSFYTVAPCLRGLYGRDDGMFFIPGLEALYIMVNRMGRLPGRGDFHLGFITQSAGPGRFHKGQLARDRVFYMIKNCPAFAGT